MDTAHQWPQEIVVKPIEEILIPINNMITPNSNSKADNGNENPSSEKKMKPQKTQPVKCLRCNSTNTKFCYYNNYSLSQPRYFCKTCRRYWTEGGSLRNIPVGGGSRKNKRISTSNLSTSNSSKKQIPSTNTISTALENPNPSFSPKIVDQGKDLNMGCFPITHDHFKTFSQLIQGPNFEYIDNKNRFSSAFELLTGVSSRGCGNSNNSFMPMPMTMFSEGLSSLPTLGFSIDGIGNYGYGSVQGVEESGNSGRFLFPFEDLKQVSSTDDQNLESNRDQQGDSTGYWNGVLGGGSW